MTLLFIGLGLLLISFLIGLHVDYLRDEQLKKLRQDRAKEDEALAAPAL
jgi:hypothetical protein